MFFSGTLCELSYACETVQEGSEVCQQPQAGTPAEERVGGCQEQGTVAEIRPHVVVIMK